MKSFIIYNYDELIEQQLLNVGVDATSIFGEHELNNRFLVYYDHDILDQKNVKSSKIVLSDDNYHEHYCRSFLWSNVDQLHALQNNYYFFIGMYMRVSNLLRQLDFTKSEKNLKNQREYNFYKF